MGYKATVTKGSGDGGVDIIIEKEGYKTLKEGQIVEFDLIKTDKGYQAQNIKPLEELQTIE